MDQIVAFWRKLPTAVRSAWITAWVAFTGTLLSILVGLLPVLAEAVSSKNFERFYDSLNLGAAAAISAATGFVSGLINGIYRWIKPIEEAYRKDPPA